MAKAPLTDAEIEGLLQVPKKVQADVKWRIDSMQNWIKCELEVENEIKTNLKLNLNCNYEERSLFSFSLILNNAYRIAGLDYNGSHRNRHKDGNFWNSKTHKHRWTERCRDSWAYTPEDIISSDIKEVFVLFCKECNITHTGKFLPLPPNQKTIF